MISFIIPYIKDPERYTDRSEHLEKCLDSLKSQTDTDFETIVIDGFQNPNMGFHLNTGIWKAEGEWLHFSQADFIYPKDHIEKLKEKLRWLIKPNVLFYFNIVYPWGKIRETQEILKGPIQAKMDAIDFYYPIADGLDGVIEKRICPKFDEGFRGSWSHYYVEWLHRVYKQGTKFEFLKDMEIYHPYNHFENQRQLDVSQEDSAESWRHFMELMK